MKTQLLFAIRSYAGLGRDIAAMGPFEAGLNEVRIWKDGEKIGRAHV